MHMRRMYWGLAALMAAGVIAGCRTMPEMEPIEPRIEAGQRVPFIPQTTTGQLRYKEGAYPMLFAATSSAVWGKSETPVDPAGAGNGAGGLLTIECRMESSFGDVSIAYDAVGFRGIDVYLMMPGGSKVYPAQTVMGQELKEQPQGALKTFQRTNQLLFPVSVLEVPVPAEPGQDRALRLVLEGYDTVFYFEWQPQLPQVNVPPKLSERKEVKAVREKASDAHRHFLNWTHKFD